MDPLRPTSTGTCRRLNPKPPESRIGTSSPPQIRCHHEVGHDRKGAKTELTSAKGRTFTRADSRLHLTKSQREPSKRQIARVHRWGRLLVRRPPPRVQGGTARVGSRTPPLSSASELISLNNLVVSGRDQEVATVEPIGWTKGLRSVLWKAVRMS